LGPELNCPLLGRRSLIHQGAIEVQCDERHNST